jgi:X-domain of DnaJ-containing
VANTTSMARRKPCQTADLVGIVSFVVHANVALEDPSEFFSMIFGGDAFLDYIGELSLMKDLTKTMDITMRQQEEEAAAAEAAAAAEESKKASAEPASDASAASSSHPTADTASSAKAGSASYVPPVAETLHTELPTRPAASTSPSPSGTSTPRPGGVPTRLAIEHADSDEHLTASEAAGMTEEEKSLREKQKKKGGLSKEQREELLAYELERKKAREERVSMLTRKLVDRVSLWTETDKGADVTRAFKGKIVLEIENLKMESFGIELLHAIGTTYMTKATSFLKSQKLFGLSGLWSRFKEKGAVVKDTWSTISAAIDAQVTMEDMARLEQAGGDDWTDERRAEYEKRVTGKILAAAWRGSKFEIQSVLREVCETLLNDKAVKLEKRVERAQALFIIGELFTKVSILVKLSILTLYRQPEIPRRKEISWPLNSSWPRHKSKRRRRRNQNQVQRKPLHHPDLRNNGPVIQSSKNLGTGRRRSNLPSPTHSFVRNLIACVDVDKYHIEAVKEALFRGYCMAFVG